MKKTIAILLVAILAVSSVFAAFSGEAKLGFGGNFDSGEWGFIDKSANVNFNIDLATATAEQIADGDVYASIKATFGLKLMTGEKKYGEGDPYNGLVVNDYGTGLPMGLNSFGIGIIADITEAKVGGENWYVSILGVPDAPNFAESAIDTYTVEGAYDKYGLARDDYDKAYNYGVAFEKANGVEVNVYDYVFGLGLVGDYDDADTWKFEDDVALSVFAKTPEYNFGGVIAQLGGVYSYKGTATETKNAIGVSGKIGFANDTLSASVATDMGFNLEGDKFEDVFDMDVAANFNWNFLTLDAYYATTATSGEEADPVFEYDAVTKKVTKVDWDNTKKSTTENVLSAQVKFDLNAFDVPVAITASAKDLLHKVDLGVKAEVTPVEGLKLTANAGYVVDTIDAYSKADYLDPNGMSGLTDKQLNDTFKEMYKGVFLGQWKFGLDAEYDFGFAKVAAGVSLKNAGFKDAMSAKADNTWSKDTQKKYNEDMGKVFAGDKEMKDVHNGLANSVLLGVSASISTESIIPGAELKLAWENADDLLGFYAYDKDSDTYNYGKITASCKIAF